ncbi:FMN-dependent NADH-azoreductase [Vibrio sp. WXL103]|uniref:FMN-dependent NADH-azoreductase n=1 Tax=Vibrio sp. WXL103 TaxID=3450710 RepID=UPI003EC4AB84
MNNQQSEQVLVIHSSLRQQGSRSRQLAAQVIDQLKQQHPTLKLLERDLATMPLPHFNADTLAGFSGEIYPQAKQAAALSDRLIAELNESRYVVIGAPVYNFAIPTQLKAWLDHIARVGVTFNYGPRGPEGKLTGKTVYLITARGGGEIAPIETQLRNLLDMVGLSQVNYIHAANLDTSLGTKGLAEAEQQIQLLFAS